MKDRIIKEYKNEAEIYKALGHPTRLFIVNQLSKKDTCVCELTEMIGSDISTVSKHLSVLRNAGIVDSVKKKNQIIYSLKLRCVINISKCLKEVKK